MGGQPTNCRINNLILNSILTNSSVHLYFLETSERFKIEHFMILKFNPRWNLTMGKPSKI